MSREKWIYSEQEKLEIIKDIEKYGTIANAAKTLGMSRTTLRRWITEYRPDWQRFKKSYSEEERKQYAKQVQNYNSYSEAGRDLCVEAKTLHYWCEKYVYPGPCGKKLQDSNEDRELRLKKKHQERKSKLPSSKNGSAKLDEELAIGLQNMVQDGVSERTISSLTGIPKAKLKEVLEYIKTYAMRRKELR